MTLSAEHIDYIVKDLHYRGIVYENLQDEILDHICSSVENRMKEGERFIVAYHTVLKSFGSTSGLRQTQYQTLQVENKNVKIMLRNYLKIALRNLRRHKFYSSINIAGLSIGIAVCMVIVLFVSHELSYDKHHVNADRIYRIHADIQFGGNHFDMVYAPAPLAATLVEDYPEIEAAVRFRTRGSYLVKRETENIKENNVVWADNDFFKIFTAPLVAGNPELALSEPNSIAISESFATKFFPNETAIGQTLTLDNRYEMKVTAVYKDMPVSSHFHFNILIAMAGLNEAKSPSFLSNNFQTYILLKEGSNYKDLEAKFPEFVTKYMMPQAAQVFGDDFTMEKFEASGNFVRYDLQPMKDIHLKSDLMGEFEPNFDVTYVYLFSAVALFILLIACINFMNLSTARSANRAKEVGVRKVMGSFRSHLMRQFLTESILLSIFSFALAIGLAYILLPVFNSLSHRQLTLPFSSSYFYGSLLIGAILVGIFAGIYPSFFLSAFKPVNVLKGNAALGMKSGLIRSSLVVFQFIISIILVIGTIAVYLQLNYIQNKKLGFNKDQVIMIEDAYALGNSRDAYKNEILKSSFIQNATITGFLPVEGSWRSDTPWWVQGKPAVQENMVSLQNWRVDYDYVTTLGMTMKLGRDFSENFPSDSSAVILNETALTMFGFEGDPIGQKIESWTGDGQGGINTEELESLTVIGVVENFHYESLKQTVGPVMLFLGNAPGMVCVRFESKDTKSVIETLQAKWKEIAPGQPFTYRFMDETFGKMYSFETRLGKVFGIFSGLAIFIACLGLFALTSFTAEQRTKEIGIRKVLGASVGSIVILLSKEFGKLIIISFVIAAPIAWYFINQWLKDYQFKVEIGWWIYALSGVIAFVIAWLTMSFQSFKAATSNPVNSLRNE